MATPKLVNFYEKKYENEAGRDYTIPTFDLVKNPHNRFEATVDAIHQHFKGGKILEVGAGSGIVASSLLKTGLEFESYTLSDLSSPRIEAAKQAIGDARFQSAVLDVEGENWPFKEDEKFDCILVVALIEHLIDPISAISRLRNHLSEDGFMYVLTPNVARWVKRIRLMGGYFPATASRDEGLTTYDGQPVSLHDEGHIHYFTYRSLDKLLTQYCGFSHTVKAPYFEGTRMGPKGFESFMARLWPEMFAELALVAYNKPNGESSETA